MLGSSGGVLRKARAAGVLSGKPVTSPNDVTFIRREPRLGSLSTSPMKCGSVTNAHALLLGLPAAWVGVLSADGEPRSRTLTTLEPLSTAGANLASPETMLRSV